MYQSIRSEVTVNPNLTISYSKVYDLDSAPVYSCSVQAIYTDATPVAKDLCCCKCEDKCPITGQLNCNYGSWFYYRT
jgi:hypothetical protein